MQIVFTVPTGGTTYTYLVDELRADWELDGDSVSYANNSTDIKIYRQRLRFTISQIFQKVPGGSSVLDPGDLYQEMIYEAAQNDNASELSFDLNGNTFTPTVYPVPESFNNAQTRKGTNILMHEMKLQGEWYDPNTQSGQNAILFLKTMKAAL